MVQGLVKIGKLTRLHGIKGAMILLRDAGPEPDSKKSKAFFIEINGAATPFFVAELKQSGKNLIISFDSVGSVEAAQKLLNKEVFAEKKNLLKEKKAVNYKGYTLIDAEKGKIGLIEEMVEMPGQIMLSVLVNDKEVLLPFTDDLVDKVDVKNKTVYYNAPQGLIDIYLS